MNADSIRCASVENSGECEKCEELRAMLGIQSPARAGKTVVTWCRAEDLLRGAARQAG
jgi:hypothetical protein